VCAAADLDAYAFRVLLNSFRQQRRRKWIGEIPGPDGVVDTAASADEHDLAGALTVRRALSRLPSKYRTVLVLRYYCDLTERQVATTVRVPIGTVKSRAARGSAQLLSELCLSDDADDKNGVAHA
jgi:RNA polymerase sigma factor (sigma-70 family)